MELGKVKEFLNINQTCVISTVYNNSPQSATVGFSIDDNLNILIGTKSNTRKARNIKLNPNVSLVIGFEGKVTVQIEGKAQEISREELGERLTLHFEKVPGSKKFLNDELQVYYLIKPNWLRFTNFNETQPVIEITEFDK